MFGHHPRHGVVVDPAVFRRHLRLNAVKHGQGVRGKQLQVDAQLVHQFDALGQIHEHRAPIGHGLHPVCADAEEGNAVRIHRQFRPVAPGDAKALLQHDVGVQVDDAAVCGAHRQASENAVISSSILG